MPKIESQFSAGKYTVLCLDTEIPNTNFKKLNIDGVEYTPEPVYDLPKSIALLGEGRFTGKEIAFIN